MDTEIGVTSTLILLILVLAAIIVFLLPRLRIVVRETETALLFQDGIAKRQLDPGIHWLLPMRDKLERIDIRRRTDVLSGQEILTKDRISIKVSLVFTYQPVDVRKIHLETADAVGALLEQLRLATREAVAGLTLEEVLDGRDALADRIASAAADSAAELGYRLEGVALRDVMLPGNLKRVYAGVLEAKKDSERRLESARGEQAVMRSLANTARMLDGNPALLNLRILQALENGKGSVVFGADGAALRAAEGAASTKPDS